MIAFVYGTTAELIKIAPVYWRVREHGMVPKLWCTGQQIGELPESTARLGLPEPDLWLARGVGGESLKRGSDVPRWLLEIWREATARRREMEAALWSDDRPPLVLVHGDTMTTVVGAALGRLLNATVGHIEAGMRSNSLLNPFPEELDRRVAGHLSHVHFTPGLDKVPNLRRSRGIKVDTVVNTVFDSLRLVPSDASAAPDVPEGYGLVLLHRFEFLRNRRLLVDTIELLAQRAASGTPMVVVADAQSSAAIDDAGLDRLFDGASFVRLGKQAYFDFVPLVRDARFVITDSGGLQEECFYLNKPCLVHRTTTEQSGGLGENVVLSHHNLAVVDEFLDDPSRYRSELVASFPSPTEIICEYLRRSGHLPDPVLESRVSRELSVIIPVRGGGEYIRSMLLTVVNELDTTGLDYEVIVVSDGSTDQTVSEARTLSSDRLLVLHYAEKSGRGFAVRYGFGHARGDMIAVIAPDLAFLPEAIARHVQIMRATGADVVNGSKLHEASEVTIHPVRRWQTKAFSALNAALFGVTVSDPQNGVKLFRRAALERVLPHVRSNGFAFDVELLAAATGAGLNIQEGPVRALTNFVPTRRMSELVRILAGVGRLVVLRARMSNALAPAPPAAPEDLRDVPEAVTLDGAASSQPETTAVGRPALDH